MPRPMRKANRSSSTRPVITPRAEAAYAEVWPLSPGVGPRIALYRLYHELNHLNLFGRAYYQGCLATLNSLL